MSENSRNLSASSVLRYRSELAQVFLHAQRKLKLQHQVDATLEQPKNASFGDLSYSASLQLAKHNQRAPMELAEQLLAECELPDYVADAQIAKPGFINIRITDQAKWQVVAEILTNANHFAKNLAQSQERTDKLSQMQDKVVFLEFVSANPTGPLHIGHGRGAAYGDCLARIMRYVGWTVHTEYYVNDTGLQARFLALSVWLRAAKARGKFNHPLPDSLYQGEYLCEVAAQLNSNDGYGFLHLEEIEPTQDVPALLALAREHLQDKWNAWEDACSSYIRDQIIAKELAIMNVEFDCWFSEKKLLTGDSQTKMISDLRTKRPECFFENEGALWLKTTDFGDDKDRVIRRSNGEHTYFASDILYHQSKFSRFDTPSHLLNVFGADHHGYQVRLQAIAQILGYGKENLEIRLIQFANLISNGVRMSMSTRAGDFYPLRQLIDEVGVDAVRYFFVARKNDQHLDFDIDLAKRKSSDNPVYYIQYAHARICSLIRKAGFTNNEQALASVLASADLLRTPNIHLNQEENILCKWLLEFPELLIRCANERTVHWLCMYLQDLASAYHKFYTEHPIVNVNAEADLREARLAMSLATANILAKGLDLLGISAPQQM